MTARRSARRLHDFFYGLVTAWLMASMVSTAAAQATFNAELNDVWATQSETGWGIQLVEQGGFALGTLFVNDARGNPIFYWAFMAQQPGQTWTGDLIATGGPWFGSPSYDPQLFNARRVGAISFTKSSSTNATLEYSVDGVSVTKNVTRQLWRYDNYTGNYVATVYVVTTHCSNSSDDGERTGLYSIAINQTGTAITITGGFAKRGTSTCTYSGDYTQAGRVGAVGTSYSCSDGDEGSMSFFELTKRPAMFSGRLQGHSITDSCDYTGAITGLVPL